MRGSLGATKRERVLSESESRRVVLVEDPERGPRVVRRITASPDGPDLVDRAIAVGLVRQVRIPGFAFIEDRALVGSTLEIAESFVDGFTLESAIEPIRDQITVSVAISLVHDIARGLEVLHAVIEPSGRAANLIHGRIDADQVMLTASGDVCVIGLEGRRGEASRDVQDLLRLLHSLLVSKASSRAGSALLARLAQLEFESAEQMTAALSAYLKKQNEGEVSTKRAAFAGEVAARIRNTLPPDDDAVVRIRVPETPTDLSPGELAEERPRRAGGKLGVSATVQMDEDEDGPTVTDGVPTVDEAEVSVDSADSLVAVNVGRGEAREGLLAPASPPKPEVRWTGPDRSVSVGNYRVVASIGRGGMGEIYLARSNSDHYRGLVALKVLGPEDSGDDEALGMFIDEASIMARIDHQNVLKVVDFGRAKGRHFLAMEYLEGRPLVRVMIDAYQRESGLDYGVIAAIGADSARGLFAAHTATAPDGSPLKVVHRDISPQNIFVTYKGITKVIDFGVARATQRVSKTAVGVVKGKAAYMSPEQTEGREVDARSDVFSLGVCLWEMTAGRRLFKRETEYETLLAVSTAPIERPTAVRGKPNPVLDRVILNALTRNRDRRTQSALELAAQLTEFVQGVGIQDGHGSVAGLMQRLFGAVAAEEQKLIRSFEERAATEDEADSLRRLSGVSMRKGAKQEITLVGAPSALLELDNFGTDSGSTPSPKPGAKPSSNPAQQPQSTGDIVLRAVEAIKAEQAATVPLASAHLPEDTPAPAPPDPVLVDVAEPLPRNDTGPAFEIDDAGFEVIGAVTGTTPPIDPPARLGSAVDTLLPPDNAVVAESSTTTKRPALAGSRARRLLVYVAAAVLIVAFTVVAFVARSRRKPERAVSPVDTATVAAAPRTERVPARPERTPAAAVQPVRTASASVRDMVEDVGARGLNVTASEGTFLIIDKRKDSVVVDDDAEVQSVDGPGVRAWLARTEKRGLTQVVWIGSIDGGPWFARALSVNDCAAAVRAGTTGIVLSYGEREQLLPHGGGTLVDVSLERPDFANRLELSPLGLAFGERDPESAALHCSIGWWGKQVVLRSLPEGRYALRWTGNNRLEEAQLVVGTGVVQGGRLVRTSSIVR